MVAGLDEVGRGSLAGPVIAAAVILKPGARLVGVNDSKLLSAARREALVWDILRGCETWGLGAASAEEIDRVNILCATRLAMKRATEALAVRPDHLLIDAVRLPDVEVPQVSLIGGDRLSLSIASASIVAKVLRPTLSGVRIRLPQRIRHGAPSHGNRRAWSQPDPSQIVSRRHAGEPAFILV
jgi:ribonuclease HII